MKVKLRIEIEEPEGSSMDLALSHNDAEDPLDGDLGYLIARLILGVKHMLCSPEETLAIALSAIYNECSSPLDEALIAFYESADAYRDRLAKLRRAKDD